MEIITKLSQAIPLTDGNYIKTIFSDYLSRKGNTSYVGSCLNTMGNYMAKAKFRLYKKERKDKKIYLTEVYEHPFLDLLRRPNDYQTGWELKYYIGLYFGAFGNYYLLILNGLASGQPKYLQMLDPSRVNPVTENNKPIAYYEYNLGSEKVKLMPEEIIHLRYPSKGSTTIGAPIIDELNYVIETDKIQQQLTHKFYKEGGFLGLTFTTNTELSDRAFLKAKKQLEERYSGSGNAFKVALFEQGLQPIKSAYSIKDMDLTNQRKLVQEEVLMAFRIPKLLMGASAEGYTKASAEAAEYTYAQSMIDPLLTYVSEVFTNFVNDRYGSEYVVKHDSVAPKDVERNLDYYTKLSALGSLAVNEIRQEEDFDPLPYELANVNLLNVGGAVIRLDTGEQLGAVPNNRINESKNVEKIETKGSDEIYSLHYKQFTRRFNYEVSKFQRELVKFFDNQKKRLLDGIKSESYLEQFFNGDAQIIMNMIENAYMRYIEKGMSFGGYINFSRAEIEDAVKKFVENSKSINETTKKNILANFKDNDIATAIEKAYRNIEGRAKTIAETTVESGFNLGLWTSYKLQGFKKKIWISMNDTEVRESHTIAHGQVREIDDYFDVGGAKLLYPGDPNAPPEEIINCRCIIYGE